MRNKRVKMTLSAKQTFDPAPETGEIPAIAVPPLYEGERGYLELLSYVQNNGFRRDDRTGTGTLASFGHQLRFDLRKGFPLLTTKKVHLRSIIHELLWFLR